MGDLEGTWGIGFEEGAEDFLGLLAGAVAGAGDDRDVQVVGEPAGEGGSVSQREVFGDRCEYRKFPRLVLWNGSDAGLQLGLGWSAKADAKGSGQKTTL